MALALYDRVQETTATTGTGSITLGGAVSGYQSFAVVGNGNTCYYTIVNGSAWEVGIGTYSTTGPTLARTTILSNSNADTNPITLSGASSVFLTYPAEKSVNLDASGNVSPLGTISSGVWQGSTVGVAYGGTGVTSSSGANSVVLRDSNANVTFNNFTAAAMAVTSAAGTTVLTAASARTQILLGSTTQTFQLPDATTVGLGQSFVFVNNSTGLLTVKDNAGTTVETVPAGGITQLGALSIATSAGTWGAYSFIPAAVDWGTNSLALGTTVISGGTWQGGTIAGGYGGTGLTTFVAANNALYSTGASTLTAGTLPVAAGGTGITSLTSGYIPYGTGTSGYSSSASLQFNGAYLVVGGTIPLGGATNPITAFSSTANNYVQTYVYNASNGTSASADFVAYSDNSTDAHGWTDMGFTSSTYADPVYTVTGPNEAYVFGSAPSGAGATGNLVFATDSTGSANAMQFYIGGFTQLKSAWKMQLTSTGLQLANALGVAYGGSGATTAQGAMNTFAGAVTSGSYLRGNGTNVVMSTIQAADVPTLNQNTTGQAGSVANALTFNSSGGVAPGSTYNGSAARTIDYSSVGAAAAGQTMYIGTTAVAINRGSGAITLTGTNIDGSSGSCSGNAATATTATNQSGGTVSATTGSFSGNITTRVPQYYSALSGVAYNSAINSGETNVGASGSVYIPMLGQTSLSNSGYRQHTVFGSYRGQQWGSAFIAVGGNDSYPTVAFYFDYGGSFTAPGNVTAYSDETLKTNWREYEPDFVSRLAKLKHGTYDRADIKLTQDGVSAQSLQTLLPNSVVTQEDGKLSVNYGGASMVSAIQLAKRVVEQDNRIAKLEALVAQLLEK